MAERQTFRPKAAKPAETRKAIDRAADKRGQSHPLYNSPRWRRARKGFLRRNPLCVLCDRDGRTTAATVVDHVVPWQRIKINPDAKCVIVCGPPGTGKTTFCRKRSNSGDLIFDADEVAAALGFKHKRPGDVAELVTGFRGMIVDRIGGSIQRRCWVIVARRGEGDLIRRRTGGQLIDLGDDDVTQDIGAFWDVKNWQPLCARCHSRKTVLEDGGFGNARKGQ